MIRGFSSSPLYPQVIRVSKILLRESGSSSGCDDPRLLEFPIERIQHLVRVFPEKGHALNPPVYALYVYMYCMTVRVSVFPEQGHTTLSTHLFASSSQSW